MTEKSEVTKPKRVRQKPWGVYRELDNILKFRCKDEAEADQVLTELGPGYFKYEIESLC